MRSGKQRYYAALEHEENAGRLFGQRRREELMVEEPRGENLLYADIGARAYKAFANILDSLGEMASRAGADRSEPSDHAARRALEHVQEEFRALRHKLEQHDLLLHEIAAGIRRIDKFTLEAFQRMHTAERTMEPYVGAEAPPGRLSKEETTERALVAARELRDRGERLTLKAVSRKAGLRYAQVVYAFGRKEELINRLEEEARRAEAAEAEAAKAAEAARDTDEQTA